MPVVEYYRKPNKVVEASLPFYLVYWRDADHVQIDSSPPADAVYDNVRVAMDQRLSGGSASEASLTGPVGETSTFSHDRAVGQSAGQPTFALGAPIA